MTYDPSQDRSAGPSAGVMASPPPRERGPLLLVGNPNVGKSLLFRHLTSHYVTVSNYPGTTVEVVRARSRGDGRGFEVVDTPGINDLAPRSEDARVTAEVLRRHPDATVVQVADAKNLRRALFLTLQLAELGHPLVLVLNMLDELDERGGAIDADGLSRMLGVPVVRTVAIRNEGTDAILGAVERAAPVELGVRVPASPDEYATNRSRLDKVNQILAACYSIREPDHATLAVRLGFWAMHPVRGLAVLAAVLGVVFWGVGLVGAGTMVDLLETGVFAQRVNPLAIRAVDALLPFPHRHPPGAVTLAVGLPLTPAHEFTLGTITRDVIGPAYELTGPLGGLRSGLRFLHDAVVGPYGAVTMALSYAFAIVLPIVGVFFVAFSLLEDSGYFPRMAILVNRLFRRMGLNGKAVLPMILGLGCDTMATMTTRILETRKERVIATVLLALAVPCSAQLGVLLSMMARLSPAGALAWLALVLGVIVTVGALAARLMPGDPSDFILEIPPLRRPVAANVLLKTGRRVSWYLQEVVPLFLLGTLALFLLDRVGALALLARAGEPLVTGWLGLPREMAGAFLIGFLRRDFAAVYILDAATGPDAVLSPHQILVAMVTITLFIPCIANLLMIGKEHGARVAWRIAAFIFPFAFFVGGAVHRAGTWLASF